MSSAPRGLLVIAFGGPHKSDEVRPFLRHVLAGRPVSEERFEAVVQHYELLGGHSPITEHTEAQAKALTQELAKRGHALDVRVGMRHSTPWLREALQGFRAAEIDHVIGLVMAAQDTEASLARYAQAVEGARAELGEAAPRVTYARGWGTSEGVIDTHACNLARTLASLSFDERERAWLLFSAHSIPVAMAKASPYVSQLEDTARRVAQKLGIRQHRLVYQSRSGNPGDAWLEPELAHALDQAAQAGVSTVVVSPIGFVCDHVEVLYDLDVEGQRHAEANGIRLLRAPTLGTHPAFIGALADSVVHTLLSSP